MLSAIWFFMEQQESASPAMPRNIVRTSTKILKISDSIHILSKVDVRSLNKKRAENCIAKMKDFGTLRGRSIGRVVRDFPQPMPTYHKGDFVIIRDEEDGTWTAEIPKTLEDIDVNKTGYITPICTTINVPKDLIAKI